MKHYLVKANVRGGAVYIDAFPLAVSAIYEWNKGGLGLALTLNPNLSSLT